MRYLFIHQSFSAQYRHILRYLHEQGGHELVFITTSVKGEMPGVRKVMYNVPPPPDAKIYPFLREFDHALYRADAVAAVARSLKELGYIPDIIIGHHGWGELLNIGDVYPNVPILGYFEFYYSVLGQDVNFDPEFPPNPELNILVRLKNTINLQALTQPGWGQTPTFFQRQTYPFWARRQISILQEGVDLDFCCPHREVHQKTFKIDDIIIEPHEKLVTYAARDLEPYRGFHSFMRALPDILQERSDVRVVIVGNNGVSYGNPPADGGTWREVMLRELDGKIDLSRVHFLGWLSHQKLISLFQRTNAHVYLTYPFVLSWSLREAIAVGCPLIVSDTAPLQEYLQNGETAHFVSFLNPRNIAEGILELLENTQYAGYLSYQARIFAEKNLAMNDYLYRYERLINDVIAGF